MIWFNDLLASAGVPLPTTKLVRHRDNEALPGCAPVQLWRAGDGRFERYQAIQIAPRYGNATHIVSFVVTEVGETLFVGVYDVAGWGTAPAGERDPVRGHDVAGYHLYELVLNDALLAYRGRIEIDWGPAYLAWAQNAGNNLKAVRAIRRSVFEPAFPGFTEFTAMLDDLANVPVSWRQILSSVGGVYLLTCTTCGKNYVGSATGRDGFWGRWLNYQANRHGGNMGMREHEHDNYHVCILEAAGSSLEVEVLAMEERWKRKLMTLRFGLNV